MVNTLAAVPTLFEAESPFSSSLRLKAGGPVGFPWPSRGFFFHLGRFRGRAVNLLDFGGGVRREVEVVLIFVVVVGKEVVVVSRVVETVVVVVLDAGIVQLIPLDTHLSASLTKHAILILQDLKPSRRHPQVPHVTGHFVLIQKGFESHSPAIAYEETSYRID